MGLDLYAGKPNGQVNETDYEWFAGYDKWPDAPHPQWSYGGFSRFRERLAEAEGFTLSDMRGFGGKREWDTARTTLTPLLDHSDCDGELAPDECRQVWPSLERIVSGWPDDDYDRMAGLALVALMKLADEHELAVLFR